MTTTKHYIKIMPDYGHEYLWCNLPFRLLHGTIDPEGLEGVILPKSLNLQFEAWYHDFARAKYVSPGSFALVDWAKFHARGILLAKELKAFIGDTASVYYEKPMEDANVFEDERIEVLADGTLRPLPIHGGLLDRMKETFPWLPRKVLSDGQPGVDRAALDWAASERLPHGGWCSQGRQVEDGKLSLLYQLQAVRSADKAECMRRNVRDSDATLLLLNGGMNARTLTIQQTATAQGKPLLLLSLDAQPLDRTAQAVVDWLTQTPCDKLHIAGSEGKVPAEVREKVLDVLNHTIGKPTQKQEREQWSEQWAQFRRIFSRR